MNLFVGYDPKEAVAYHVFCESVLAHATEPVTFRPLHLSSMKFYNEAHGDGSNAFIYSRFLVPFLMNFKGWAIYCDGDMLVRDDLSGLWSLRNPEFAVQVVKHDYQTKQAQKYLGAPNHNYPRKNWSSVIIWNCGHPKHRLLTPEFVASAAGSYLHRFSWLDDAEIGELDKTWNWLVGEYPPNTEAHLVHFTLGTPCFKGYRSDAEASEWMDYLRSLKRGLD